MIYIPTRIRPGNSAPMNMSPAEAGITPRSDGIENCPVASWYSARRNCCAVSTADDNWSARMISTIDGGMICPSVPEARMTPVASGWL